MNLRGRLMIQAPALLFFSLQYSDLVLKNILFIMCKRKK